MEIPPPVPGTTTLDAFSPDVARDPYPLFARLRGGGAAQFAEELGMWVVSRDDEVRAVLADPAAFSSALTITPVAPICPQAGWIFASLTADTATAECDGPRHARARRALMAAFPSSPRKAAPWEPRIRAIADELIDELPAPHADLVPSFASELAVRVILEVLGIPAEAHERIKRCSGGRFAIIWGPTTDAEQVRIARDTLALWECCQELVAACVAEPREDVLGALFAYRAQDGASLGEREIASVAFDVLSAGHETASNMVSNAILTLLSSGAWEEIVADPIRIPAALEETLRYDTFIPAWLRVTTRAVTIGDSEIPAGQRVVLLLGSANRDERRWADAASFDIARADAGEHVSFSVGRHFCAGAALARLEGRVALEALAERLPGLRLRDGFEPRYVPSVAFRALEALPVTWHAVP
jgi:cytochrome P450